MKIWLVKIGEPVPIKNKSSVRLLRSGILSEKLSKLGHDVIFWTSTFDHFNKKLLFNSEKVIKKNSNYTIELLHGKKYKKNVSLSRVINHYQISKSFKKKIKTRSKPDIIICSFPTIGLSYECIKFGIKNNIPVFIDIRDLWPDIFFKELLPALIQNLSKKIYSLFFNKHLYVFKNATGLIGITDEILDWGLNYANRKKNIKKDAVFHLAFDYNKTKNNNKSILSFNNGNLSFDKDKMYVVLAGTLSKYKFDFNAIIDAITQLNNINKNIFFIICGEGELLSSFKRRTNKLENIFFTGWIDKSQLAEIMSRSTIGLAPYNNSFTYNLSIPSKISEYLSYGLIVVSSLSGKLEKFLREKNAGYTYSKSEELVSIINKVQKENYNIITSKMKNNIGIFKTKFDSKTIYNNYINFIIKNARSYKKIK